MNRNHLHRLAVRVPPFAEQRRISAVLAAFDELIDINERRIELLENVARSVYREWFARFRFPGHEREEFRTSELGPLPASWGVKRLEHAVTFHQREWATKPDPELSDEERADVKQIARKLMAHITDRLVLDWRRKAETREAARVLVRDVLDELPEAYDREIWQRKTDAVFNHIFASYYDDGSSVYDHGAPAEGAVAVATLPSAAATGIGAQFDIDEITRAVLEQIRDDPRLAEQVAERLKGKDAFFAVSSTELIAGDETFAAEFKSTARWNLRDAAKDKRMEDAVVKTIAGFLNTDGGTLFIGIDDQRRPIGLHHDTSLVKPPNADGLVNWLTTHLVAALTHATVMRTRTKIEAVDGEEICRVDVARSSRPVTARMSDKSDQFWVRMNNSTRAPRSRDRGLLPGPLVTQAAMPQLPPERPFSVARADNRRALLRLPSRLTDRLSRPDRDASTDPGRTRCPPNAERARERAGPGDCLRTPSTGAVSRLASSRDATNARSDARFHHSAGISVSRKHPEFWWVLVPARRGRRSGRSPPSPASASIPFPLCPHVSARRGLSTQRWRAGLLRGLFS